jgi:hypothetical protein
LLSDYPFPGKSTLIFALIPAEKSEVIDSKLENGQRPISSNSQGVVVGRFGLEFSEYFNSVGQVLLNA